MGNWWLAPSSPEAHSCILSCAEISGKTSNHPDSSAPLQPRFGTWLLLAFPKQKSPLKGKRLQTVWDSGKYDGVANGDRENYMKSQGTYFEGDWGVIILCTMFLVSCIFFNKCLYFSYDILSGQTSYIDRFISEIISSICFKIIQ